MTQVQRITHIANTLRQAAHDARTPRHFPAYAEQLARAADELERRAAELLTQHGGETRLSHEA